MMEDFKKDFRENSPLVQSWAIVTSGLMCMAVHIPILWLTRDVDIYGLSLWLLWMPELIMSSRIGVACTYEHRIPIWGFWWTYGKVIELLTVWALFSLEHLWVAGGLSVLVIWSISAWVKGARGTN